MGRHHPDHRQRAAMVDLAARIPEIGRHNPVPVRRLFLKHQDRIVFATDFQVYDRLTLGSGGSGPPPGDDDAVAFYERHWRWLETNERLFRVDALRLEPQHGGEGLGMQLTVLGVMG